MKCANPRCDKEFVPRREWAKFCSALCRKNLFDRVERPLHRGVKRKTVPFMDRPFNTFDGEGESPNGEGSDILTLLADDERELYHADRSRLTTRECLEWLLDSPRDRGNVWYSFGYDVTHILRDLSRESLQRLRERNKIWWGSYRIEYLPNKLFRVSHSPCNCRRSGRRDERCKHRRSYTAHDVFGFFQCSFLATMETREGFYKSKAPAILEIIEKGKAARGSFDTWEMSDVIAYNRAELVVLKEIMENFREAIREAGFSVNAWWGAGALASDWMKRERAVSFYADIPEAMEDARDRAFAGGRIDSAVMGEVITSEGDVASAYPAAICELPDMPCLRWQHVKRATKVADIGLYHVKWKVPEDTWWGPFFFREPDDTMKFPLEGEGWYHAVEVRAAIARFPKGSIRLLDAWTAKGPRSYPFRKPVERDYKRRAEFKHMTPPHPANVPLKLALNSIYGKMAMRVGVKLREDGTIQRPRSHNLFYAGMITAWTRARISEALLAHGDHNVFMIATDGVFVRGDWKMDEPQKLGAFEIDSKTYRAVIAGPGMYQTETRKREAYRNKKRGFGGAPIDYRMVLKHWRDHRPVKLSLRRMVTIGQASLSDDAYALRGCFIEKERELHPLSTHPFAAKRFTNPYEFPKRGEYQVLYPGVREFKGCSAPYQILRPRDLRRDAGGEETVV